MSFMDRVRRTIAHAQDELLPDDNVGFDRPSEGGGTSSFVAKLMTEGPEEEADYSDARYWVQEVDDTSESETDALILAPIDVEDGGRWVTATNLLELGIGGSDAGTHAIVKAVTGITVPDRFVLVSEKSFGSAGKRYVFESYPGQLQEDWYAFLVSCRNGDCPEGGWYRMDGPGFISQTEPPACS